MSTFQFGLLFSVYSFPNMGLVLFGGYLVDRLGNRIGGLIFCGFITLGTGKYHVYLYIHVYILDESLE